jgi:hypothetical protein
MAPRHGAKLEPRPDDALNDQIQALMRQGAEKLEERDRTQAAADATSAKRQLDAVIALAKGRDRATR